MSLSGKTLHQQDIPPEIMERLMNTHHMSWLALSSHLRIQEDPSPHCCRQPDFASWIQME